MKMEERKSDNSYFIINYDLYCNIQKERSKNGMSCFSGNGGEVRTKDSVPKCLPKLKKAFENLPFSVGDKFVDNDNPNIEYHVEKIYWQYYDGYWIEMLIHKHYDPNNYENKSHGTRIIRSVNSPFAEEHTFKNYTKIN